MPVNGLIIRGLIQMFPFYGPDFTVECPTGSGNYMTLFEVAKEIARRNTSMFLRDANGQRPVYGGPESSRTILTGGITSSTTSTSMATMAQGWVPVTRPGGLVW
jgi:hypothetical protein